MGKTKNHNLKIGYKNVIGHLSVLITVSLLALPAKAQYEVATWSKFKAAAVTYTFDDNTASQLTIALPLFNQYNYKVTFFPVPTWGPNWSGFQTAANNGHEIGSHTYNHVDISGMKVSDLETELTQSVNTVNSNITGTSCTTIAYPFCKSGDKTTLEKYFIAARVCSNGVESKNPSNFMAINAFTTGSEGPVKVADDFNAKVQDAKNSNGWCVFLTHAINGDQGFSPTQSTDLATHLAFVNANSSDYWVAPFKTVAKYIKERNAATFSETTINADSLKVTITDNLDNTIYNEAITIRRTLPSGWQNANVYAGTQKINSSLAISGGVSYIVFDAVPDNSSIYLAKAGTVTAIGELNQDAPIKVEPNPFSHTIKVKTNGIFSYTIFTIDGRLIEKGTKVTASKEVGANLTSGTYILNVVNSSNTLNTKIVKN